MLPANLADGVLRLRRGEPVALTGSKPLDQAGTTESAHLEIALSGCGEPMFPDQRLDMDHLTDEAGRRVQDNVYVLGYLSAVLNACRSGLCGGGGAGQRMFAGGL